MDTRFVALQLALQFNELGAESVEDVLQDAEKFLVFLEADEVHD